MDGKSHMSEGLSSHSFLSASSHRKPARVGNRPSKQGSAALLASPCFVPRWSISAPLLGDLLSGQFFRQTQKRRKKDNSPRNVTTGTRFCWHPPCFPMKGDQPTIRTVLIATRLIVVKGAAGMVAMNILHPPFKSFYAPLALFLILQGCSLFPYKDQSIQSTNIGPIGPIIPDKPSDAIEKKQPGKVQVGKASWYGGNFQGKRTASGTVFDPNQRTAAHRTFPLGSRVRVTRLDNNKSVEVEITDRGPFVDGRIIDLSRAAAASLGMLQEGTVTVQVELLDSTSVRQTAVQP